MENCVHQMHRSFGFVKELEFVECTKSLKFYGKSMNVPNRENSMENCVHQMYRYSELVEKFDFVESSKS